MLSKKQKRDIIKDLTDKLKTAKSIILTDFTGLTVNDLQTLRRDLSQNQAQYQVVKKTLLDLALKKANLDFDVKKIKGSLAIGFSQNDEVGPAKTLYNFSQKHENLKLLAGILIVPDKTMLNYEEVLALAKTSDKQELIAKIIGSLNAPLRNLTYLLKANLQSLVYILKQKAAGN